MSDFANAFHTVESPSEENYDAPLKDLQTHSYGLKMFPPVLTMMRLQPSFSRKAVQLSQAREEQPKRRFPRRRSWTECTDKNLQKVPLQVRAERRNSCPLLVPQDQPNRPMERRLSCPYYYNSLPSASTQSQEYDGMESTGNSPENSSPGSSECGRQKASRRCGRRRRQRRRQQEEKAAVRIQAWVRGSFQRLRTRVLRLEVALEQVELQRQADLLQVRRNEQLCRDSILQEYKAARMVESLAKENQRLKREQQSLSAGLEELKRESQALEREQMRIRQYQTIASATFSQLKEQHLQLRHTQAELEKEMHTWKQYNRLGTEYCRRERFLRLQCEQRVQRLMCAQAASDDDQSSVVSTSSSLYMVASC